MDLLSVGLVTAGVVLWLRPIEALRTQDGHAVQADTLANTIAFLFLGTQLTSIGIAFYAYSLLRRLKVQKKPDSNSAR